VSDAPASGLLELPRYEIRDRLGEGATAIVYSAWDRELKRPVALKVLKDTAGMSAIARERFHREARAAAGLGHPNVVTVYDAGEKDGRLYLVLELVEGRPLGQILQEGAQPIERLLKLVEKAARGMGAAHAKGIVHRDLKPANILVTADGEPKVADFGLAHLVDSTTELTRTGTALGTPLYMSPEQADGRARDISPRTDVYALGVLLYEIATGRTPHVGESLMEIYGKIVREEPVMPRRLNPRVSPDLETIIAKALEKQTHRRYADAGELAEDLRRLLDGEPISARPVRFPGRLWRKAVRHRAAVLPTAAAALLALAAGTWAVVRSARQAAAVRSGLEAATAAEREGRLEEARDGYRAILVLDPARAPAREGFDRIDRELKRRRLELSQELERRKAEAAATRPDPTLVAHWKLDELDGRMATDASGNKRHGRFTGGGSWRPAKRDGGLRFDGTGEGVQLPEIDLRGSFTISLWAFLESDRRQMSCLIANTRGGAGTDGFKLCVNSFDRPDRKILLETGNGREGSTCYAPDGSFSYDTWHHVTVVVDRSQAAAWIYVDGLDVTADRSLVNDFRAQADLRLGSMTDGNARMKGVLDDVRVYGRALTSAEIRALAGRDP
jgi:tRNA A-37 threonylcarbamoyl transferase component Bud32